MAERSILYSIGVVLCMTERSVWYNICFAIDMAERSILYSIGVLCMAESICVRISSNLAQYLV